MSNAKVISELLERGKQSGKLSTKEITDAMEEMDIDAEQINKLYDDLEANNIEIVDDIAPDDLNNALDFNSEEDADFSSDGIAVDDPVKVHLKEIGRIPLLSAEEEIQLAEKISAGDEYARDRLIEANLRLVVSIAKHRYAVPRPDSGRLHRSDKGSREVRPHQGLQVLDLRHMVDKAVDFPRHC